MRNPMSLSWTLITKSYDLFSSELLLSIRCCPASII